MADQDLTQLPETTSAAPQDLVYVVKSSGLTDARITVSNLLAGTALADHTHTAGQISGLFTSSLPFADGTANVGTGASAARYDHVHPANVDGTNPQALGATAAPGTSTVYARRDHVHPRPTTADIGAVPTARTVATSAGLTGGGDLSANRTLSLNILGLADDTSPDVAGDYVAVANVTEGHRRVRIDRLPGGSGGGGTTNAWYNISAGGTLLTPDGTQDTLSLVAGSNISLSADPGSDTITISSTGGGSTSSNAFGIIRAAGQSDINADAASDSLTFAGSGIATILTNAGTSTVTVNVPAPSYPNNFSTFAVRQGGTTTNVVADTNTDTVTISAGANISLTADASTDTITISATQPTVPNIFGHIKVAGNATDIIPLNANDTFSLAAGSNVTLVPDATNRTITISASGGGSSGSSTLWGLADVDDSTQSASDGARLEYDTGTNAWIPVSDDLLSVPLNHFLIGDAGSNAVVATPQAARIAMADICQVVINRFTVGTSSAAVYRDLLHNLESGIRVTGLSLAGSGTGSFRVLYGAYNTGPGTMTAITWQDGNTIQNIPGGNVVSRFSVQTSGGLALAAGNSMILEVSNTMNLVDVRGALHFVRAG